MLHNCRSRQVRETLNGVHPSSGFRDTHSVKSGSNLWQIWQVFGPWASLYGANGQMSTAVHNYSLSNYTELRTEKIRQAVTEIWILQIWHPPACPDHYDNTPQPWRVKKSMLPKMLIPHLWITFCFIRTETMPFTQHTTVLLEFEIHNIKWHLSYSIRMSTQVIPTYSSVSTSKSINSGHPSNRLSLDIMVFWTAQSWHDGDLFTYWFSITLCKWPQFNTADLISLVLKTDSTWDSTGGGKVQLRLLYINDWLMGHVAKLETKGPCHSFFFTATVKTLL